MNVGIVGSRSHPLRSTVSRLVAKLPDGCTVISGGAIGIDTWAVHYAKQKGLEAIVHKPEWDKFGKSAGFKETY